MTSNIIRDYDEKTRKLVNKRDYFVAEHETERRELLSEINPALLFNSRGSFKTKFSDPELQLQKDRLCEIDQERVLHWGVYYGAKERLIKENFKALKDDKLYVAAYLLLWTETAELLLSQTRNHIYQEAWEERAFYYKKFSKMLNDD